MEFILIILGILNLCLFYKVWYMTNDVKTITNILVSSYKEKMGEETKPISFEKTPKETNHVAFACMLLIPLLLFALIFFIN